jgi:hypothetical protein
MTQKPPKIESPPPPRRLGVGSWWVRGFWLNYGSPHVVMPDGGRFVDYGTGRTLQNGWPVP